MHQVLEKILKAKHIALIVHINPDADSLGSASAFYSYILQLQKKVTLFSYTKNIDRKFLCLPWLDKIKHQLPPSCDMFISFDCADKKRLGVDIDIDINFDHHKSNKYFATLNFVDKDAISTTELLYNYFISENIKINPKMATALYAGLIDDSKNFTDKKCGIKAFDIAKDLLQKGADKDKIVQTLFHMSALSLLRLKGLMFSNMRLFADAEIVVHTVSQDDLKSCGAKCGECEDALEESLSLATVDVALLLCEKEDGEIKGSIRTDGTIDASKIAKIYGGGGHRNRAGFVYKHTDIQIAAKQLIKDILEEKK